MTVYYVRPVNGSDDSGSGESFADAFQTTQRALDACTSGNEIRLIPEAVESITAKIDADTNAGTITAPIRIRVGNTTDGAYDASLTYTIQASNKIDAIVAFTGSSDYTTWEGVVFDGNSNATNCISNTVDGADWHTFIRCEMMGATNAGVLSNCSSVNPWRFYNCYIHNNNYGLMSNSATRGAFSICSCKIANNASHGIYAYNLIRLFGTSIYKNGGDGVLMRNDSGLRNSEIFYCTIANNTGDGIEIPNNASVYGYNFCFNQIANNGGYGINLYALTQHVLWSLINNNFYNNALGVASVAINAWPYTTYDPKFVNIGVGSEDYRIHGSTYSGFPSSANGVLIGACTVYGDWPSATNVTTDDTVDGETGEFVIPDEADVRSGVVYGAGDSADSYTGSLDASGEGATAQEIWEYANRTLSTNPPTAVQIRQEIDSNSTQLAAIKEQTDQLAFDSNGNLVTDASPAEIWSYASKEVDVVSVNGQAISEEGDPVGDITTIKGVVEDATYGNAAIQSDISALNNLSQADIRTAVGLSTANLDTQMEALSKLLNANQVIDLDAGTLQYIDAEDGVTVLLTKHCYTETGGDLLKISAKTDIITQSLDSEV